MLRAVESHHRVLSTVVIWLYLYFTRDCSDYHLQIGFRDREGRATEIVPAGEKLHLLNIKSEEKQRKKR